MASQRMTRTMIITILGAMILAGCAGSQPAATSEPTRIPSEAQPLIPLTPTSTAISKSVSVLEGFQEAPVIPSAPLSSEGPWFVIVARDGFWAVNPDGTGLTQIVKTNIDPPFEWQTAFSPGGGYIAYISARDRIHDLTLNIISLPYGTSITEIPLTTESSEQSPDTMPGDPAYEAIRAIIDIRSLAWSPNGQMLAFMGMIEGPTSDLYIYSVEDDEVMRLTDGPSQSFRPSWSPDSKYIVHAGAEVFGTGAGYCMNGIWAARADDSGIVELPMESSSSDELFVGWLSPTRLLNYSWNASCGPNSLRITDIDTRQSTMVWEGSFYAVAMDPATGSILFSVVSVTFSDCNPDGRTGLLIHLHGVTPPAQVTTTDSYRVIWSDEIRQFFSISNPAYAISVSGEAREISFVPAVSPDSQLWATRIKDDDPGIWVGPPFSSTQELTGWYDSELTWSPDGDTLFFFGPQGLYIAQSPDFVPLLIGEGLDDLESGWIWP